MEKQTRLAFLLLAVHVLLDDGAIGVWLEEDANLQNRTASKYYCLRKGDSLSCTAR